MELKDWQKLIDDIYGVKDRRRGLAWTFAWLVEEIGELGSALRKLELNEGDREKVMKNLHEEFADCLAWLSTTASIVGIKFEEVIKRYESGCPYCKEIPCVCKTK